MIKQPKLIESLTNVEIVRVACGFAYSACVSADGELYTWGAGENGRLGNGSTEDVYRPKIVPRLSKVYVTGVFAGSVHTCIVTKQAGFTVVGSLSTRGTIRRKMCCFLNESINCKTNTSSKSV